MVAKIIENWLIENGYELITKNTKRMSFEKSGINTIQIIFSIQNPNLTISVLNDKKSKTFESCRTFTFETENSLNLWKEHLQKIVNNLIKTLG